MEKEMNNMGADQIVKLIKTGLENWSIFSPGLKDIKVNGTYLLNAGYTLTVDYISGFTKALDIKVEISTIMVFCASFLSGEFENSLPISRIAVKALDDVGNELLFAITTKELAKKASRSNVEWLRGTYFQENTEDYRLMRAKAIISDIENGLRRAIVEVYSNKHGNDWWNTMIGEKIRNSTQSMYENNYGELISDGNILIDHTFTRDLKKIICSDWEAFSHLFPSKIGFENEMDRFNELRRIEAHNRSVSRENLVELEKLYEQLLLEISKIIPGLEFNFMLENWKIGIKSLGEIQLKSTYTIQQLEKLPLDEKIRLIVKQNKNIIQYLQQIIQRFDSLKPPISKKQVHERLRECYLQYQNLEKEKLSAIEGFQFEKIQSIEDKIKLHKSNMDEFSSKFLLSES
ncbi:hypothetical protein GCM10022246_24890 [Pedobacter ginsengiterrae]|uniref:Swt1-like HEPN domain-containing protein n=1 Tax=Pedobacter ginsengiterrae TaxID=871696 RepID=A0ABP7PUI4_9SPHI